MVEIGLRTTSLLYNSGFSLLMYVLTQQNIYIKVHHLTVVVQLKVIVLLLFTLSQKRCHFYFCNNFGNVDQF